MRSITLAIAAVLLLASCSDDPQPIEPAGSPSTGPSAPTLPSDAREPTPEGQVAFVRYVVRALNFSVNSGSTDVLEAVFDRRCEACSNYIDTIRSDHAEDGEVDGFNWTVSEGDVLEDDLVEIDVTSAGYSKVDPSTGKRSKVKAAKYQLGFRLIRSQDHWMVRELYLPGSRS